MARALTVFGTVSILWVLVAQLNHVLAPLQIHLFIGGLFVTLAALRLSPREGLAATLLAGALADANSPVWFGTHLLLFATAHVVIFHLRDRLPWTETVVRVLVALFANLGIFLALSVVQLAGHPATGSAWLRLFFDLLCSQLTITLIGPWFFALQIRALQLLRLEPAPLR